VAIRALPGRRPLLRTYVIDGQQVTVTWVQRQHPPVCTIRVAGMPVAGSIERTALGSYLALDAQRRVLGTSNALREAVEHVIRAERG
jgi:hypothetical protein